jgi:hypothetical protein
MRIEYLRLLFLLFLAAPAQGQDMVTGTVRIAEGNTVFVPDEHYKEATERPFRIEAVFESAECSNSLISIEVHNAHPPLTWYELDEAGQKVHTLFNPQLNYFNDHTTYLVQDMSQHTDTIYIDFDQVMAVKDIHPNPHRGVLFIRYSAIDPVDVRLSLVDMSGRTVMNEGYRLLAGENSLSLDLVILEQGVYFLGLDGPCVHERMKIIHLE